MAQYFNLTLDTTAPSSGILGGLNSYYKGNATVTISASGASYMKVWTNQTAIGTTSDTQIPSSWEPYATSKTVSFTGQGTQYVHALFMDEVGNISSVVNSSATVFDNTAPTVSTVSINNNDGYTRVTSNTVRVAFTDATSGVATVTLSGDIASGEKKSYSVTDAERTAGYKDISVTFSTPDGTKTVTATVTDRAGNTSTSKSDTIVYDTTAATMTAALRKDDDSANLSAYVKETDFGVRIATAATDIVSYKIWEGNTEPSSWTAISGATEVSGVGYFVNGLDLSDGDGLKTIHVKIQDIAGNITESPALTTTLDTTPPVIALTLGTSVISAVSGYDSTNLSWVTTDTNLSAGVTYQLELKMPNRFNDGAVAWTGMEEKTISGTNVVVNANDITDWIDGPSGPTWESLTVPARIVGTDAAGNTGISNEVVITLDRTAPTGSVTASTYYNTSTVTVTVSGSDTGGATLSKMKVYLDNNVPSSWENYTSGSYSFTSVAEGAHIAHVQFRDSVGNESSVYNSSQLIVDTTAPTGTISTSQYTNSRTITVNVSASDAKNSLAVSGVDKMKIWEAGQTEPSTWDNYAATKSITLAAGSDGVRTINAKFKDKAGNETATANIVTCTTTLDLDDPDATLNLLKTDGNGLPAKVNYRDFKARIGHTAPDTAPISQYKLTGDFTQSSSDWKTFTPDSGKDYMTISSLTLTTGEGLKTITVQLKDAAGNVSSEVIATVTYDTSAPVIDVNAPDYNVVSKQHTLRLNASGSPISGKYNDVCIFTWSANENLAAYKVCVNVKGQAAATAVAIGTTGGSLNMTGGATAANTNVTSTIYGADFAATSAVDDTDGAYEIIVYGQDEGGTWSAIHALS